MADQPTDQELFQQAVAPPEEPPKPPPEPPAEPVAPPEPPSPPPPAAAEPPEAGVPSWRLREEAEARRLAEDRARQLQDRLSQIETHLRQQASQAKPSDFFENPDAATQAAVMRILQPFVVEFERRAEDTRRGQMAMGKMVAETVHGADSVAAAEQAFLEAKDRETLDVADYERVVGATNRYDAVVQWHRRQSMYNTVGNDPEAWYQQRLQKDLENPEFQAKVIERARTGAATRPSATKLPPSLSKATAAAGNSGESIGDMSDRSLFDYAMNSKR